MHLPPVVALWITIGAVFYLYRRDSRQNVKVSKALWIPLIWFLITGSRFVSQWMSLGNNAWPFEEEGSPIDAIVFLALIISGLYVLSRRRITLEVFARSNPWLTIFLVYCLVAILWSDFPLVAFKRWIKILGHPIMALVVLTDPDPIEALRRLLRRSAYFLILFSILFIKYFPQFGRGFDYWTGEGYNQGVTHSKNELGYDCMISGLFFFWNMLVALKIKDRKARRSELLISFIFMGLIWWLLKVSSSATSLTCMLIGSATMVVLGFRFVSKRHIGLYVVLGIVSFAIAESMFGIYTHVIAGLGRDANLTDRTAVWHDALALQPNPLFGAGFESFWLGKRLDALWAKWWWRPIQAHNGYIETYLNLGWVGIAILVGVILDTFRKIRLDLLNRFQLGRFRLAILFTILVYNFTEATFKGVHLVWTLFYLIAIDYPRGRSSRVTVHAAPPVKGNLPKPAPAGEFREYQTASWRRQTGVYDATSDPGTTIPRTEFRE
jgi:exopolysaccharide production protein ExoQ